jgi:hypothetical protein
MLAPRKTLWSTPDAVVDRVLQWVPLEGDIVCDIGCGDGKVILQWASTYSQVGKQPDDCNTETLLPSFVGIDIDAVRIQEAEAAVTEARAKGSINPGISISFHCANALEATHLFQGKATVFFLYLIPRGLRKIKPVLLPPQKQTKVGGKIDSSIQKKEILHQVRVVTYMSPLPDETPDRRESIPVPHQPGAAWPLYLYTLSTSTVSDGQS